MLSPLIDRLRLKSLRARLTAWNAAVVLLMTVVSLLAARFAARSSLYADADADLRATSREVAFAIRDLSPDVEAVIAEMSRKAESHQTRGWFMHLLTADGATVWKSEHCPNEVAAFPPQDIGKPESVVQVGHYRYVRTRVDRSSGGPYLVRVGTYTTGLDENLTALVWRLAAVGAGLSLLAPLIAYWLAMRATRPVSRILETADSLRPTRLGDRLPDRGSDDELDRLSRTINRLLDAVARHVDRQERFVADAAHELRGPLTALQSSLEMAITHEQGWADRREQLTDMLEAARHLTKVANDLLLLAQAGDDRRPASHGPVDLATVCRRAVNMFSGAAEERGIELTLDIDGPASVVGEVTDLRRLVSNVLDNALRFTPTGGRIAVRVADMAADSRVVLSIADTGSGIAPRDLQRIFDRFYKSDESRSHGGPYRSGGLGLAICRSIAESCGGSIGVTSTPGAGTTVTVRLQAVGGDGLPKRRSRESVQVLRAGWGS